LTEETLDQHVVDTVTEKLDPETFDIFSYIEQESVADDTVDIYVNTQKSMRLTELMNERNGELARRREAEKRGDSSGLSLADDDEDTEYDTEINQLVEDLEKSKLVFTVQTVAPALRKAIEKSYLATQPKKSGDQTDEEFAEAVARHANDRLADVLARAIKSVALGDGTPVPGDWDKVKLQRLEHELHAPQSKRLIDKLWEMVNIGHVFDEAINADFS